MKKYITTVIVMVLLLVVAPWGIGQLAEQRINAGLDQLAAQTPYLSIAQRTWNAGWFRSEQEVTFEVVGPMADVMKAAATQEPLRFTIRNEILHGPVLWPASVGLARVNSKLIINEAIRRELIEVFGTDEPVRVSTRVGFLGGGTTRFSGDARTLKLRKDTGVLAYDAFYLDVGYTKNLDMIGLAGEWPRFEYTDSNGRASVLMEKMTLTSQNVRIRGDVYDSDFRFTVDKIYVSESGKAAMDLAGVHYILDTTGNDDFVDFAMQMGTGRFRNPTVEELKLDVSEVHYDFTLRRLHAETLEKFLAAAKASYEKPVATVAEVEAALTAPYKEYGLELLKHDPELVVDRVGVVTSDGEGVLKGVIRLKGVTGKDIEAGTMALLGKVEADLTVDVAQQLIDKLPNGTQSADAAIEQGFARRDGARVVSHIEFKQGKLKINGKAQAIPGFGSPGPNAGAADPRSPHSPE